MKSKQTKTQNTLLIFLVAIVFSLVFKTALALTLWIAVCVIFAALQWLLFNPTQMTFNLTIGDWEPCKGIQKLGGFSRGLKFHRVDYFPYWHISNSIVLGYNRSENEDTVRLWAYGYVDGKHFQEKICEVKANDNVFAKLRWFENWHAVATVSQLGKIDKSASVGIKTKTLPIGWQLFPFAEIDGTNKKKKFEVDITNIKIS